MRAVRMKVFQNGLNPGDVAGFEDEIAARMIARGEAVALEPARQLPVATAEQKVVVEKAAETGAQVAQVAHVATGRDLSAGIGPFKRSRR
jgi:hypothetical protein